MHEIHDATYKGNANLITNVLFWYFWTSEFVQLFLMLQTFVKGKR